MDPPPPPPKKSWRSIYIALGIFKHLISKNWVQIAPVQIGLRRKLWLLRLFSCCCVSQLANSCQERHAFLEVSIVVAGQASSGLAFPDRSGNRSLSLALALFLIDRQTDTCKSYRFPAASFSPAFSVKAAYDRAIGHWIGLIPSGRTHFAASKSPSYCSCFVFFFLLPLCAPICLATFYYNRKSWRAILGCLFCVVPTYTICRCILRRASDQATSAERW